MENSNNNPRDVEDTTKRTTEEEGVTPTHDKDADIGAGRQIGDPLAGTLSDRAGDEGFDDGKSIRIDDKSTTDDDL